MNRLPALAVAVLALLPYPLPAQQLPSSFTPIVPCRLYDSRALPGGLPLQNATTYQIPVRGQCGIPETANAIFLTVIALDATSPGWVTIWPSDRTQPTASTFNFRGNGTDSSATFSRLCAPPYLECSGVDLQFRIALAPTHLVLDVVGYTEPLP